MKKTIHSVRDRGASKAHMSSDYFLERHTRELQAYRRDYDFFSPSGACRKYEILLGRIRMPVPFSEMVKNQLHGMLPFLLENELYSVQDLLGLEFLQVLQSGERRMVDLCIEHMIGFGLPLQSVHKPAGQPRAYRFLGQTPRAGGANSMAKTSTNTSHFIL